MMIHRKAAAAADRPLRESERGWWDMVGCTQLPMLLQLPADEPAWHLFSTVSLSSHCLKGRCSTGTCSSPPAEAMSGSSSPPLTSPDCAASCPSEGRRRRRDRCLMPVSGLASSSDSDPRVPLPVRGTAGAELAAGAACCRAVSSTSALPAGWRAVPATGTRGSTPNAVLKHVLPVLKHYLVQESGPLRVRQPDVNHNSSLLLASSASHQASGRHISAPCLATKFAYSAAYKNQPSPT